ncbi:MAG: MBL fold metallo-hydrolase [Bacteriovoracaceae bacterium]|jgi:glyoxylase-like metal-dependent hydrolase (beta-lactamase superfamily II)|nr:MBL fold metallo-hydrolase [Halobacteriovoraceae bacterium]MDP7319467.1 MBL fold metallo-hydrolase [Bacteriovoracaceae bacterium]
MTTKIKTFYDETTFTLTYVVSDEKTKDAVIIDPVLDFDAASGKIFTTSNKNVLTYVNNEKLNIHYILETHAHADHLSGAHELKNDLPQAKIGIHETIQKVQDVFKQVFNRKDLKTDGSQFDVLFKSDEIIKAGSLEFKVIHTPGHTPACSSYLIDGNVFTGDALFMPDFGTGRCDFPAGSSEDLYQSVHEKLYKLPDDTKVYVGHDYQPGGRELEYQTTIGESKQSNIQLKQETTKEEFIEFRNKRDATLDAPKLLLPSIQVNIAAGELPESEDNGKRYLKLPLTKES